MRKRRVARWANRRRGGRRKPIYRIEAGVATDREHARLHWVEVKRYRTAVIRLPKEIRRKGDGKSERCPIPVMGKVLAETVRPVHEFWARSEGFTDYVAAHLPRPQPRRR